MSLCFILFCTISIYDTALGKTNLSVVSVLDDIAYAAKTDIPGVEIVEIIKADNKHIANSGVLL
ncbi:hypothetical protein [Bacillus cereus]|nr:hypothetical protein [Bacillus cereus]